MVTVALCVALLDSLPNDVSLAEARAVALIPTGQGEPRTGVLVVKGERGWADPVPVALHGVRDSADLVLVFRTPRSLDRVRTGDGVVSPDVAGYERRGGSFGAVYHDGAVLARGASPAPADVAALNELKVKLTARASPAPKPVTLSGVAAARAAVLAGLAVWGAWLAGGRRRR